MKVAPTLNGGLRIDAEDAADWEVLRCIVRDARSSAGDLADRLGALVDDEPDPGDWEEFVVPELREGFEGQLRTVAAAVERGARESDAGIGSLEISRAEAETWYGALNQARLAIEDALGLAGSAEGPPADPNERSAFFRSQFYLVVQGMLLEHVIVWP